MLVKSSYIIYKQTQSENPKNCPERDLNPRPRLSSADVLTTYRNILYIILLYTYI